MLELISFLFGTKGMMPHGSCFLWNPPLLWLIVIANAVTAIAYFSIPITLAYFTHKRKDVDFKWLIFLFSAFIFACGVTHVLAIVTIWVPIYWVSGIAITITAIVSVLTAIFLWKLIPQALLIPSPSSLLKVNTKLEEEIIYHKETKLELQQLNNDLDRLVEQRTQELKSSEYELRLSQTSGGIGTWKVELDTYKLTCSENYSPLLGFLALSKPTWDDFLAVIHLDDRQKVLNLFKCFRESKVDTPYDMEYRITTATGDIRWIRSVGVVECATDETPPTLRGIVQDVTDNKHLTQELSKHKNHLEELVEERTKQLEVSQKKAEAADQAKSRFLANMSHEIRTPLNAIIGFAYLLQNDPLTDFQQDQLAKQSDASNHLLHVINDILDLSKIDAGMLVLHDEDINIEHLLTKVFSLIQNKASKKGIKLFIDVDHALRFLKGDGLRIEQVLINLVSNAVKFTEEGSISIHITKCEESDLNVLVRFEVVDTGMGMPPEVLDHIFASFEQADGTITRSFGGTGLGLTISKKIIQLMDGKIGVSSQLGEGSTFWFEITLNKSSVKPTDFAVPSKLTDKRVLVVDDLAEARESLHAMLLQFNIYTETTNSGINAIKMIEKADQEGSPFHIVLLDWQMPDMDGIETATKMLALPLRTKPKIIFVTAYVDFLDKHEVAELSHAHLTKPVTPSPLHDALVNVLSNELKTTFQINDQSAQHDAIKFNDVHILLAEDNPINQDVAIGLLKNVGVKVALAENGQIAFDMAKENHYDLIIMDLQMPVLDGFESTLAIRALPQMKEIPILAMTANAFNEDKEQCMQVGMNAHIAKPVSPNQLYKTLADYLPKEKVSYAGNALASQSSHLTDSVIEQIKTIDGLDIKRGMCNVGGDGAFYLGLLKKFVKQYNKKCSAVLSEISANTKEDIQHLAHALKGSAATLGIINLWTLAETLEKEAKSSKQNKELILKVEQIINKLNQFELALSPILEGTEVVYEQVKIDEQKIYQIIEELESLLKTDDAEVCNLFNNNKGLFKQAFGAPADILENQIDSFDFSGALNTLRTLDLSVLEYPMMYKKGL